MKTTVAGIGLLVVSLLLILARLGSDVAAVAIVVAFVGFTTLLVGLYLWIVGAAQERKYRRGEVS